MANQTRHFENLTDGSVDRRQAFPWVAAKGGAAWLRVDFAEPATLKRITWHDGSSVPADYTIEVQRPDGEWQRVAHTEDRLPRNDDTRAASQVKLKNLSAEQTNALVSLIATIRKKEGELNRLTAGPQIYAASFTTPDTTWLLRRGDPMQRMAKLAPAIPSALGQAEIAPDAPEPRRRLALAKLLTQPDHPLTARVLVNRVWQTHFGNGLVDTPSDFGKWGAAPPTPELLAWLALGFTRKGWSLKKTAQAHRHLAHLSAGEPSTRTSITRGYRCAPALAFPTAPTGCRGNSRWHAERQRQVEPENGWARV